MELSQSPNGYHCMPEIEIFISMRLNSTNKSKSATDLNYVSNKEQATDIFELYLEELKFFSKV